MYNIDEIKSRISCLDYARQNGINVNKPGDRTYSPFHTGKNPTSFAIYDDSWYSFSDSIGGDVIDLCAFLRHNGDKGKAIADLAGQLNMRPDHETAQWRDYMQELGNRIFYYNTQLTSDDYEYLHSRGVSDATISALKLGRNEEGRLVIPYWKNGYVAYFATRSRPGCKYPDSKYRKMKIDDFNDHCVWGLNTLDRQSDCLIIAEGAFDALAAYEQGYPVISAITGHFSSKQLPSALAACRQYPKVVLTYDDDSSGSNSGEKFTIKMAKILHQNKIPFVIAPMPRGFHDLSEYHAAKHSIADLISGATDGMEYLVSIITDPDELSQFIHSIARSTPGYKLTQYTAKSRIDRDVVKDIVKAAKNCPQETIIADEIRHEHELIYVIADGFYEWDSKIWRKIDETKVQAYAIDHYGKIFATAQRAQQVMKMLKVQCAKECIFNHNNVFSFTNGTLELDTGIFREHRQADYCSLILDYEYDPDARCPRWEQFIDEIMVGNGRNADVLQQIAGYVMYPDCKFQKIFCLIGDGANGKSVYLDMLKSVYTAANCTQVPPANMSNEFHLIHLKDSLLNFAAEIDADFTRVEATLKLLSDGSAIQACYKGKDLIKFEPRAKLVFACNAMPETRTIQGMERRMVFLNFPMKYVDYPDPKDPYQRLKDPDLLQKLEAELPGIFNWCYAGYRDLIRENAFTTPSTQDEYIREFRESSNPVEIFVHECTEEFVGTLTRKHIYERYRRWCEENGHVPRAANRFHSAFRAAMGKRIIDESRRTFEGKFERCYMFGDVTLMEDKFVSGIDFGQFSMWMDESR